MENTVTKLTDVERALLINQLSILKLLAPRDARYYDEKIEILRDGYEFFYDDVVQNLDTVSTEDCKFVIHVLDMYRWFDTYIRKHSKDKEVTTHHWARFAGFSGNDETALMGFTRFLIKTQGKFAEQIPNESRTDGFNSHAPVREVYERMLAVYEAIDDKWETGLKRENVLSVLAAAKRRG
ncbi:hypothetical protein BE15_25715 [Sorangium cellulosum]|uniref:YfbU family protein n=2 Tax=Sorangium cellulosum TaxID=56 RepID=A0A150QNY7_SORCE|nr:hypothetical protein BE15_25715 [Sorangium cellulosum]